ncbi:hypothetical protein [Sphingomonas sp.]
MLLYYFSDKSEMVTTVLARLAARMQSTLDGAVAPNRLSGSDLIERLRPIVLGEAQWPYMRLWLEIAARASTGDALCRDVGEGIARSFVEWIGPQLLDGEDGRAAFDVLASIEGEVLLRAVGVGR